MGNTMKLNKKRNFAWQKEKESSKSSVSQFLFQKFIKIKPIVDIKVHIAP